MERTYKSGKDYIQWNDKRPSQAYKYALTGMTDKQIAKEMEVADSTFEYWKRNRLEFLTELNRGRMPANANVAKSLYKMALGYDYKEQVVVKSGRGTYKTVIVTKHKCAESWAAVKILSMRMPELWSETHRVEVTNTNINISKIDLTGFTIEEKLALEKVGIKQLTQHIEQS